MKHDGECSEANDVPHVIIGTMMDDTALFDLVFRV